MDILLIALFYILATLLSLRVIGYGIYEWKEKNKLGGSLTIAIALASYVFFAIMMWLQ